jgi:hypothetical protein
MSEELTRNQDAQEQALKGLNIRDPMEFLRSKGLMRMISQTCHVSNANSDGLTYLLRSTGDTIQAQVTIMLREFAHDLGLINPDGSDPTMALSKADTKTILDLCKEGIDAAGHS